MNTIQLDPNLPGEPIEALTNKHTFTFLGSGAAPEALMDLDILDLAEHEVDFPMLPAALAECPITCQELSAYLDEEISDVGPITQLRLVRTALAFGERYWVWEGVEPVTGCWGYATVSVGLSIEVGFEVNWEDLSPEQFIVGVHYRVI